MNRFLILLFIGVPFSAFAAEPVTYEETSTVLLRQVLACERIATGAVQRVGELEKIIAALNAAKTKDEPVSGGSNGEK